jgi:hypothetical protein
MQSCPAPQVLPQVPQFALSVRLSTQAPPQAASPELH